MAEGLITHIQTYSTKDGPGIRSTVFFVSCNLRCKWCANPEAMFSGKKLFHQQNLCKKCGKCVSLSSGTIEIKDDAIVIDRERCEILDELSDICNYSAFKDEGKYTSDEKLYKALARDKYFFETSNGGVTFSGGEPFLQPKLLSATMERLKNDDIHIAIETAGLWNFEKNKDIIEKCDLFLYDIKAWDEDIHKECTGVSNKVILETARKLANAGKDMHIRMVVVPRYNDDKSDIVKRLEFAKSLGESVKQVDILKYHNYGEGKYKAQGLLYPLANMEYDEDKLDETVEYAKTVCESMGMKADIGG